MFMYAKCNAASADFPRLLWILMEQYTEVYKRKMRKHEYAILINPDLYLRNVGVVLSAIEIGLTYW